MPDFSKARIGDSVYELINGAGVIKDIKNKRLWVKFGEGLVIPFEFDGSHANYGYKKGPVLLYWSKPEISDPPPPKRMIKKKQKFWMNIYPGECDARYASTWETKRKADEVAGPDRITVIEIEVEWEEEE